MKGGVRAVADEAKNKMSKKVKIIIAILLALVILSGGALAGRVIYLKYFADTTATVVVPDNLIGEETSTDTSADVPETSAPETSAPTETSKPESNITNGSAGTKTEAATVSLYKGQASDNEKFEATNMFPGDSEVKYFAVKVNHHADAIVYFSADVTEQTKQLADVLHIKVTHLENGKVLYDGTFAEIEKNTEGFGETFAAGESTETVAYYKVEVSLPTSAGNEYQEAKLLADFGWFVKDDAPLDSPQTGDNSNISLWLVLMCSSLAVMIILLITKREEREAEGYAK